MTHATMWVVNSALTGGIYPLGGAIADEWFVPEGDYGKPNIYRIGREVFPTKAEAIAAAEKMRLDKIEYLKSEIARLESLKFE